MNDLRFARRGAALIAPLIGMAITIHTIHAAASREIAFEGRLYSSSKRAAMLPYPATITEVLVRKGDRVKRGAPLFRYQLPSEAITNILQKLAPSAGTQEFATLLYTRREDLKEVMRRTMIVSTNLSEAERKSRTDFINQAVSDAVAPLRELLSGTPSMSDLRRPITQTAPINATIIYTENSLKVGAIVQPSSVMVMGVDDPMRMVTRLTEQEARHLALEDRARVDVQALPQRTFEATLIRNSRMQNGQAASYELELSVPNPNHAIKDGFKARVTFGFLSQAEPSEIRAENRSVPDRSHD